MAALIFPKSKYCWAALFSDGFSSTIIVVYVNKVPIFKSGNTDTLTVIASQNK